MHAHVTRAHAHAAHGNRESSEAAPAEQSATYLFMSWRVTLASAAVVPADALAAPAMVSARAGASGSARRCAAASIASFEK